METLVPTIAATAALGIVIGFLLGKYVWPAVRLEDVGRLQERERLLDKQVESLQSQQSGLQDQLKVEFENIATRVLRANARDLEQTSERALAGIVDPLRERILDFQTKVDSAYDSEKRDILALKEQIRLIVEANQSLGRQADGLAKALRGDVQILGRWGELVLERILEQAGLREGTEYISQGRGLTLKSEEGSTQKPDIILLLPEKRTMIVDSKVSLASYDRMIAANGDDVRSQCATQLVRDMKLHIDGLAGKRYQDNDALHAHDCVLMFVPIEGALAAALTADSELFTYGWERRVVLVGPPTLLMTLRTIGSIWSYELQAQNAQEIARLAGSLCDKIADSLSDFNVTTERMNSALAAHHEAVKRLTSGKGNALSIGERIRSLGVKTKKSFPGVVADGLPPSGLAQPDAEPEDE